MRAVLFWSLILILASGASSILTGSGTDPETLRLAAGDGLPLNMLPVPEPSRSLFLGLGLIAITVAYRSAWLNWKRSSRP